VQRGTPPPHTLPPQRLGHLDPRAYGARLDSRSIRPPLDTLSGSAPAVRWQDIRPLRGEDVVQVLVGEDSREWGRILLRAGCVSY